MSKKIFLLFHNVAVHSGSQPTNLLLASRILLKEKYLQSFRGSKKISEGGVWTRSKRIAEM